MKYIAHRGLHERFAENSREAVLAAFQSSADGVEVDLRQLKGGRIVFHHDGVIRQQTGCDVHYRDLRGLTHEQFLELTGFNPLCLSEALVEKPPEQTLVLECKPHRHNTAFCRSLLDILSEHSPRNVVLSSESWSILRQLALRSSYPLAPVVRFTTGLHQTYLRRSFFREVHLRHNLALDDSIRERFEERGIPIVCWTVNDTPTLEELKRLGIDGVMTDNEQWLL